MIGTVLGVVYAVGAVIMSGVWLHFDANTLSQNEDYKPSAGALLFAAILWPTIVVALIVGALYERSKRSE